MNSTNTSAEKNALREDGIRLLITIGIVTISIAALALLENRTQVMQRLFAAPATQSESPSSAPEAEQSPEQAPN